MGEREFVLSPLCDLTDGRLTVPGLDGTVGDNLRRLVRCRTHNDETTTTAEDVEEKEEEEEEDAVHVLCLPRNRTLPLHKTVVMGILNTTPDSFSDGGFYDSSTDVAVAHARKMIEDGAGIIDIGGESTRPGAKEVEVELELERVVPVICKLREGELWFFIARELIASMCVCVCVDDDGRGPGLYVCECVWVLVERIFPCVACVRIVPCLRIQTNRIGLRNISLTRSFHIEPKHTYINQQTTTITKKSPIYPYPSIHDTPPSLVPPSLPEPTSLMTFPVVPSIPKCSTPPLLFKYPTSSCTPGEHRKRCRV